MLNVSKEKSIISAIKKQDSEPSEDYSPPPIYLGKMDSNLSEED